MGVVEQNPARFTRSGIKITHPLPYSTKLDEKAARGRKREFASLEKGYGLKKGEKGGGEGGKTTKTRKGGKGQKELKK